VSLPPLQEMCWCGLPAGTRMPGVLAHCCVDHQVPEPVPALLAPLATLFRPDAVPPVEDGPIAAAHSLLKTRHTLGLK
jgi:hypothetical protein